MKLKLTLIFVLSALTSVAQDLALVELQNLCKLSNWETGNTTLVRKGWEYHDSRRSYAYNEPIVAIVYGYNKNTYGRAAAWVCLFTHNEKVEQVLYDATESAYKNINASLTTNGYKKNGSDMDDGKITTTYESKQFMLKITMETEKREYTDATYTKYTIIVIRRSGLYDEDNGEKVDYYYSSSTVKRRYTLKNGKINGKATEYFRNGSIESVSNWTNGTLNGAFTTYDEDGKVLSSGNYLNGKRNGVVTEYTEDGEKTVCTYKNGKLEGKFTIYYPNGKTKMTGSIVNEKRNGQFVEYDENGKITSSGNYINGEKNGTFTEYSEDGEKTMFTYKNGEYDGKYTIYYLNGRTRITGCISNGEKNGQFIQYNEEGKKTYEYCYKNGQYEGKYIEYEYDDDGNLWGQTSGHYKEDEKDGRWETKVMVGEQLKTLTYSTYSDGILNGDAREWTGGDSVIFCSYKEGKLDGKYQVKASLMNLFFSPTADKNSYITITDGSYSSGYKSGHWEYKNLMGQTTSEGYYINDKKEGEWKYYEPDFVIEDEIISKGGVVHDLGTGKDTIYDESVGGLSFVMKLKYVKTYKYGRLDGKLVAYRIPRFGTDSIDYTCYYQNGQKHGYYIRHGSLGETLEQGDYSYGKRNGDWKEDSVLVYRSSGRYKNGNRDGVWTYYDFINSTQLQKKCEYKDGKKDGTWEFYDKETGEKTETLNYKQDKLSGQQTKYANNQISVVDDFNNGFVQSEMTYDNNGNPEIKYEKTNDYYLKVTEYKDTVKIITEYHFNYSNLSYTELFNYQSFVNLKQRCQKSGDYLVIDNRNRTIVSGQYNLYKSNNRVGNWQYYFPNQNIKCVESFDSESVPLTFQYGDTDTPFSGQFKNKAIISGQPYKAVYNIKKGYIQKVVYTDPTTEEVVLKEKCKNGIGKDGKRMDIYVPYK
ncbi:MAG: hypothetical protein J6Y24_06590 [Bacteroidales bacterium]|nr:hypothetical protein [Bacteroidales bacterium]